MIPERRLVLWFVGLSGSGKTTLAESLAAELRLRGQSVYILDADAMRQGLCANLGFMENDRIENIRRIAHAAKLLSDTVTITLVATISPFRAARMQARAILPEMLEVFVDAPLALCEKRDPKGLYKKARAGIISNFTGIDSPFEPPLSPDIVCRTGEDTLSQSLRSLLHAIAARTLAVARTNPIDAPPQV